MKKEGARLHTIFKLTDFPLSFTLKKVKFVEKREGPAPAPPSKSATEGGVVCVWGGGGGGGVGGGGYSCQPIFHQMSPGPNI